MPELQLDVSVCTDVGCRRPSNEDAVLFVTSGTGRVADPRGTLALVADGMGGHQAGETASRLAVEEVSRAFLASPQSTQRALRSAFATANRRIFAAAAADPRLAGMGTTCVALAIRAGQAFGAHVGDSRLYLVRDGVIRRLTEDHSLVSDLVRQGVVAPAAARHHPDANVILRALGTHPDVEVTIWDESLAVRADDCFVLSTDGLHGLLEDDEIRNAVLNADAHAATGTLVALAKARGGHDNITAAVVAVRVPAAATRPVRDTRGA